MAKVVCSLQRDLLMGRLEEYARVEVALMAVVAHTGLKAQCVLPLVIVHMAHMSGQKVGLILGLCHWVAII